MLSDHSERRAWGCQVPGAGARLHAEGLASASAAPPALGAGADSRRRRGSLLLAHRFVRAGAGVRSIAAIAGPSPRAAGGLEILRQDHVGLERREEAIDLLGHVGLRQPLQVGQHVCQSVVKALLKLLDRHLVVDPFGAPLAVGTPQEKLPMTIGCLAPADRLDKVAMALGAAVQRTALGLGRLVVESHDLDLSAAG